MHFKRSPEMTKVSCLDANVLERGRPINMVDGIKERVVLKVQAATSPPPFF